MLLDRPSNIWSHLKSYALYMCLLLFTNDVDNYYEAFKLKIQCKLYSKWKKVHWLMYLLINFY